MRCLNYLNGDTGPKSPEIFSPLPYVVHVSSAHVTLQNNFEYTENLRELFKITLHLTFSHFPAVPERPINNHSFIHILLFLSLFVPPSLPLHTRYKNLSIFSLFCYLSNCAIEKFTIKKFEMTYAVEFSLGFVIELEACYFTQISTRRLSKGENVTPVQKQTLRRTSDA